MKISYPQLFLFMFQEHDVCEPHWLTFRMFLAVAELPIPELVKMNIYPKLPLKINYCIALAIIGCTSNPVSQSTFPCHKTNLFRFDTPFVCLSFLQHFFMGANPNPTNKPTNQAGTWWSGKRWAMHLGYTEAFWRFLEGRTKSSLGRTHSLRLRTWGFWAALWHLLVDTHRQRDMYVYKYIKLYFRNWIS